MSRTSASSNREIDLYPTDLEFAVFSSEDVKKLSVVKVITGLTFDSLGRALPGGLYDAVMGSYGRSMDPCHTCYSFATCPGHMGHLELSTLVYNPFFKRVIYDILGLACLDCYRLQIQDHFEQVLCTQLDLVDAGLVTEAQELEIYKSENVFNAGMNENDTIHPKIREMRELIKGVSEPARKTKNCYAIQTAITNTALQKNKAKNCIYCQNALKKVRFSYQKLVVYVSKSEREALKEQNIISEDISTKVVLADECRNYLREIYSTSAELLRRLFPILKNHTRSDKCPMDYFFMDTILVTPPKSRPTNLLGDRIMEHPQTLTYRKIIESNSVVRLILHNMKNTGEAAGEESKGLYESAVGDTPYEKLYYAWQELQSNVDNLLDISQSRDKLKTQGLKQVLEKKEGLIRRHMMGKRVNYAARTVITPDPYINVDEVGVPELFAKKLSYPVPVTPWNAAKLRKMVINGPDIYPGANYIQDEKGYKTLIPADDAGKRISMAKLLLAKPENGVKLVNRHVLNGDIMLLNRQPTLHKPSIMAHKARILRGEKTFRLHYSNCKSYNADFDGDEMNAHLPQSEVARSEAYNIVNVPNQYLVPKDGTPLGGLIQDHVIAGVKLSIRGRFFNKEDYHQLVYQGLAHLQKNIKLLPPAVLKPLRLWSGKQVLSTIINNIIPEGCPAINLTSTAKLAARVWQVQQSYNTVYGGTPLKANEMCESAIIIRKGELHCGVLDKQQYGATPYGLVHCMYELYGGECSTRLLTSFTRLFTYFLKTEGFTLGVRDILILREADEKRRKIMRECREAGHAIAAEALGVDASISPEELTEKLRQAHKDNPKFRTILDRQYKAVLDGYTNNINKVCLPNGLVSKFPDNNLQLMVLSGAKGSLVNTMQISCLLGQIELEGKRPPIMISGKSLPSFAPYDTSPRAGGFIDGRFLTGIQPEEFFFHCMAGREGLIDTAVKTSRSGYLQRCLIKHLEGLNIAYDLTVRDSDNSVIQFLYGEDGLDIGKSQFLNMKNMNFLEENIDVINHATGQDHKEVDPHLHKYHKKLKSWRKKNRDPQRAKNTTGFQQFSAELRHEIEMDNPQKLNKKTGRLKIDEKIIALWNKANAEKKQSYSKKYTKQPDPLNSKFKPDLFYGAVSEYFENLIENYEPNDPLRKSEIKNVLYTKGIRALAQPGEPVGLLAAQSIGEPSTQMTLNTFHFAGRGEMNVTLGIPRLREILMLASANIKTPSMDIPFKPGQEKNGEKLRTKLNRITVAEVLEYINVKHKLVLRPERKFHYTLYFKFLPKDAYDEEVCIKPKQILKYMSKIFVKLLFRTMSRSNKSKRVLVDMDEKESKDVGEPIEDDAEPADKHNAPAADDSSDDDIGDEDDATGIKLKARKRDENDYDDPEEEEELKDANDEDDESLKDLDEDKEEQLHQEDDSEIFKSAMNHQMVSGYEYDRINYLWCKLQFDLPMAYKNLDISSILREVAQRAVIYEVPHIKRAITYLNNKDLTLKTDGINIVEMFKYNKILDLNRLYTNDIHAISQTYGIEAAARVIVKEVQNVFKVYGITVNPRHLLLIADYMTFDGTFKPLSRKGMEFSASPLQQMSFESCLQFLRSATILGKEDELSSPSSRLMVGLPIKSGTGSFSLLAKLD